MAGTHLPEDIMENIFSRLPVKSLIRFTCLSRHYHSLILSDPVFARTQFKLASSHRLLISSNSRELGSLDLDTPSLEDDKRKPNFRFLPDNEEFPSTLLGSCNGLVFLLAGRKFFVCNPSTGWFKKLPFNDTGTDYHGVGYLSATDDYKVVSKHVVVDYRDMTVKEEWEKIFSLRARVWKKREPPSFHIEGEGTLSNEALHWIHQYSQDEMVVFDLATEKFRRRQVPNFDQDRKHFTKLGVTAGGNLCVLCYPEVSQCDSLSFWVMGEYEVDDSWSQLFNNLKLSHPEKLLDRYSKFLITGSYKIILYTRFHHLNLTRIDHKGGKHDRYEHKFEGEYTWLFVTKYEESLLRIDDERERRREQKKRSRAAKSAAKRRQSETAGYCLGRDRSKREIKRPVRFQ